MKKKTSRKTVKKSPVVHKELRDILVTRPILPAASPHNGEVDVEFNKYIVVYSNNVTGNQQSVWRAGGTCISCYKDDAFVGVITFYETRENMNGGYIDANGVLVVEYPMSRFADVMQVLKTFSNLYLMFVQRDHQGALLPHPVGGLMTFAKKSIGSA